MEEKKIKERMSAANPLRELLNAKLNVLPSNLKDGKVITVDKTASLQEVLELLAKYDIKTPQFRLYTSISCTTFISNPWNHTSNDLI